MILPPPPVKLASKLNPLENYNENRLESEKTIEGRTLASLLVVRTAWGEGLPRGGHGSSCSTLHSAVARRARRSSRARVLVSRSAQT